MSVLEKAKTYEFSCTWGFYSGAGDKSSLLKSYKSRPQMEFLEGNKFLCNTAQGSVQTTIVY